MPRIPENGSSSFITNSGTTSLIGRISTLVKHSEELRFLVGFFFFSGIRELTTSLKENETCQLKVLVGLEVDKSNFGIYEFASKQKAKTAEETLGEYLESLTKSLNEDEFDTEEFYNQARFYIEMLQSGRLEIRKTLEPNHAKLYLFNLNENQVGKNKLFITGSSNLTRAGLIDQNEFNVEISDYGFEEASDYFQQLWDSSTRLTAYSDQRSLIIETLKSETHLKQIEPLEAFFTVLDAYLNEQKIPKSAKDLGEIAEKAGYRPYKYQTDAASQAISIIQKHGGVIIADVVGLGKSVIAAMVAKSLNGRGLIIAPPGLVGDKNKTSGWTKYCEQFGLFDWEVRSSGDLESATEFLNNSENFKTVIVDEAHKFRNQDTQAYEKLKNLCRNKNVILLTATPFNNSPEDLLSLLKLFVIPKKSSLAIDGNLAFEFSLINQEYVKLSFIRKNWNSHNLDKKQKAQRLYESLFDSSDIDPRLLMERTFRLATRIRNVLEPVTIRRNRLDLQNNPQYSGEIGELPSVRDPAEWFFELDENQLRFYTSVVEEYFGEIDLGGRFKGAIYRPFHYEKSLSHEKDKYFNREFLQQQNLFDFMRRLLVKRFESSFGAFEQSIRNFRSVTALSINFLQARGQYILDRGLILRFASMEEDEIDEALDKYRELIHQGSKPKNHKVYTIEDFEKSEQFMSDMQSDLELFDEILDRLSGLKLINNDPKLEKLISGLKENFEETPGPNEPIRKVVIFTEYLDTLRYLKPRLKSQFGERVLVIDGPLTSNIVSQINADFDASQNQQTNNFDILLASDRLSEGFNLNRAGLIINYDIPWNPVRVIQRLGRINRISSLVFKQLGIVNFFPTELGADLVKSREIAASKMFLIHSALGEDSKIFEMDESPSEAKLYERLTVNPETLETESFHTRVRTKHAQILENHPEYADRLQIRPKRLKCAVKAGKENLFVFVNQNGLKVFEATGVNEGVDVQIRSLEEVFDQVIENISGEPADWDTTSFWIKYDAALNFVPESRSKGLDNSLEAKARLRLDNLKKQQAPSNELATFVRTLREDLLQFGTLPDFTLRRISTAQDWESIIQLMHELGPNYLLESKNVVLDHHREIVVAIENRSDVKG